MFKVTMAKDGTFFIEISGEKVLDISDSSNGQAHFVQGIDYKKLEDFWMDIHHELIKFDDSLIKKGTPVLPRIFVN